MKIGVRTNRSKNHIIGDVKLAYLNNACVDEDVKDVACIAYRSRTDRDRAQPRRQDFVWALVNHADYSEDDISELMSMAAETVNRWDTEGHSREWMTKKQIAWEAGISYSTVNRWVAEGKLESNNFGGSKLYRVDIKDDSNVVSDCCGSDVKFFAPDDRPRDEHCYFCVECENPCDTEIIDSGPISDDNLPEPTKMHGAGDEFPGEDYPSGLPHFCPDPADGDQGGLPLFGDAETSDAEMLRRIGRQLIRLANRIEGRSED